jgi:phosphatidylglycerophosphatase A
MSHFGVSAVPTAIVMAALVLFGSIVCVLLAPTIIATTGIDDPRQVVADELAGQSLTFLPIPFFFTSDITSWQICMTTALGFLLFRIFDIAKPWPIRKLEKLPKGWGVLADDLLAAVFAAIVLVICHRFWIAGLGA